MCLERTKNRGVLDRSRVDNEINSRRHNIVCRAIGSFGTNKGRVSEYSVVGYGEVFDTRDGYAESKLAYMRQ
jgi:hypothetical protein